MSTHFEGSQSEDIVNNSDTVSDSTLIVQRSDDDLRTGPFTYITSAGMF